MISPVDTSARLRCTPSAVRAITGTDAGKPATGPVTRRPPPRTARRYPRRSDRTELRSGTALTGSAVLIAPAVLTVLILDVPARATHDERSL